MKIFIPFIVLLLLLVQFDTIAQESKIVESAITFTIKNTGINVDGTISELKANINFNGANLKNSYINVSLDPATVDTGVGMRDKHLKKEDYFDIENYKVISMESVSFTKINDQNFKGIFKLTLKGTTKVISIPFQFKKLNNGQNVYTSEFELNRLDYNIGSSSLILSDEVKVSVTIITE